ncbi:hypothetical protein BDQ12DRAFT_249609 [Crucibulum laeve]|uniref:Uncharacterized protein n=1 Tax=Crucibulum laeve TaxID=68775 RepID=A0A5C3M5K6_9AGAR|nr:hypothetical protein BDQ12DRAFT_249609 [Crucibulum laeve]
MRRSFESDPSSSPSSSSLLHLPRSTSPLHFPHCHSSTSAMKHTRAQDISRLLDPTYSSQSTSASSASVYVDHHGDLHDPDYRAFPLVNTQQQKRRSGGASGYGGRPRWELYDEDALDVDEDDELDEELLDDSASFFSNTQRYSHGRSYPSSRRSSNTASSNSHTNLASSRRRYSRNYAPPSYPTPSYYSTSASRYDSSPPTSYESDETMFHSHDGSLFLEEKEGKEKKGLLGKKSKTAKRHSAEVKELNEKEDYPTSFPPTAPITLLSSRPSKGSISITHPSPARPEHHHRSSSFSLPPVPKSSSSSSPFLSDNERSSSHSSSHHSHHDEDDEEHNDDEHDAEPAAAHEWTPTCTQSLKRQWQAISLRFRFGVFRAQRRVKRRVHSLL